MNTDRLRQRLREIYGPSGEAWLPQVASLAAHAAGAGGVKAPAWDERDAVLIAYGDHVRAGGERPLRALRAFLARHRFEELFSTVHLLPFFPHSSDDGFSVIDYTSVDPALGDWDDIRDLRQAFDLMFDLVLNHVSQHSRWFQDYLQGREPYARYFHEVDPAADLSAVARPRSLPLLTEFATSRGPRQLWTTFSADQVDLNFAEPQVLLEMADVLLQYVHRGARIIRLDAIAYLWKQIGTACIHLPQTHAVVKFFRELLALAAPQTLLLTETNVPHAENISYFGDGDEAQMVYQFSLPPLLLDAWLNEDARPLMRWLAELAPAPQGSTFFNFTASHDGIGVRPLEGLVSAERFRRLADLIRERGGLVSTRHGPDGRDLPYELNITYFDALTEPAGRDTDLQVRRFLASQALMLALRGIPGVYLSSLWGAGNDLAGVEQSGQARRINRRKFPRDELDRALAQPESREARVLAGYRRLLATRRRQPAFHPDAEQSVPQDVPPWLVAVLRVSRDQRQRILTLVNVSGQRQSWRLPAGFECCPARELIAGRVWPQAACVELDPYQPLWLESAS
ncbi:MAG: sugar phosphorylase [Candidatus Anammoximicrobium sp.]|nr:sugar phosphorylase [Candidatus Anammoximicrobium sp.]